MLRHWSVWQLILDIICMIYYINYSTCHCSTCEMVASAYADPLRKYYSEEQEVVSPLSATLYRPPTYHTPCLTAEWLELTLCLQFHSWVHTQTAPITTSVLMEWLELTLSVLLTAAMLHSSSLSCPVQHQFVWYFIPVSREVISSSINQSID